MGNSAIPCGMCGEGIPIESVVVDEVGDVVSNVEWCPECNSITDVDNDRIPDWFKERWMKRADPLKMANDHGDYIAGLVRAIYVPAFIHGFKHGEAAKTTNIITEEKQPPSQEGE